MNLEIKSIYLDGDADNQPLPDSSDFNIPISVEIGEKDKEGSERFHFVAASPVGLASEVSEGEFKLLRGYILMAKFNLDVVRRSIENLINHAKMQSENAE